MNAPPGLKAAALKLASYQRFGKLGVVPFQPAWPVVPQTPLPAPLGTL